MSVQATGIPVPQRVGADLAPVPRSLWRDAWVRIRRSRIGMASLAIVAVYMFVGVVGFSPIFETKISQVFSSEFQPPKLSLSHPALWLGTDIQGHSVLWQLLYGTRLAMTLAVVASGISIFIAVVLGTVAGYFGGWIDDLIVWLFSTVSNIPWIVLVVALAFVLQTHEKLNHLFSGLPTIILALSLTSWVGLCRLIRGEVLKLRERDFVVAARALGLGHARIIRRHILPNVVHLIIIDFSLETVSNVQAEVVLAFLGLGFVQKPSWGRMIDDSKLDLLRGVWWQLVAATAAIFIFSLAMNLLGDVLRDALDPRLRGVD